MRRGLILHSALIIWHFNLLRRLICSDLISRGIDLPHVSHVISYDIPSDLRKYVHRVGRTARAGNAGAAWSLVEDQEVAPFKAMMKGGKHWEAIKRVRVKEKEVEGFTDAYQVSDTERASKSLADHSLYPDCARETQTALCYGSSKTGRSGAIA